MTRFVLPAFAGVLFSVGLMLAGMTQPAKVIGFLDFAGHWDPSLAFVMVGGIAVFAVFYRVLPSRTKPLFAERFSPPTRKDIDPRLIVGASLFGVGWGLSGFCPGPALAALGAGAQPATILVPAMVVGMYLASLLDRPRD